MVDADKRRGKIIDVAASGGISRRCIAKYHGAENWFLIKTGPDWFVLAKAAAAAAAAKWRIRRR